MPLGQRNPGSSGSGRYPLVVPKAPASATPGLPPDAKTQSAGDTDLWRHRTIDPGAWTSQGYRLFLDVAFTKIDVFSRADELYMRFGSPASSGAGSYDLFHPGGGFLSAPIPPTTELWINTVGGAAPADPIEVWVYSGAYALRY